MKTVILYTQNRGYSFQPGQEERATARLQRLCRRQCGQGQAGSPLHTATEGTASILTSGLMQEINIRFLSDPFRKLFLSALAQKNISGLPEAKLKSDSPPWQGGAGVVEE